MPILTTAEKQGYDNIAATIPSRVDALEISQASANTYSTVALGLASTANGQYFAVVQQYGNAADLYLNSTGTAVAQNVTTPAKLGYRALTKLSVYDTTVGAMPVLPIISINSLRGYDKNGKYIPNTDASSQAMEGNYLAKSSLALSSDTKYIGASGNLTAKQIALSSSNIAYYLTRTSDERIRFKLPGGLFTVQLKVKSQVGFGNQTIYCGDYYIGGMVSYAITEASWTTITIAYSAGTVAGTDTNIWFYDASGASYPSTFLADEVQAYAGDVIPAYSTEVAKSHLRRFGTWDGCQTYNGWANTTRGLLQMPSYPSPTVFTEFTAFIAIDVTSMTSLENVLLSKEGNYTDMTISVRRDATTTTIGELWANPIHSQLPATGYYFNSNDRVVEIVGIRLKPTEQCLWADNIALASTTANFTSLSMNMMGIMQNFTAGYDTSGKVFAVEVFNKWLSDAECLSTVAKLKQTASLQEENTRIFNNFLIIEGDSMSRNMFYYATNGVFPIQFTPTIRSRRLAYPGDNLIQLNARLPETLRLIASVIASGRTPIIAVLVGANAIPATTDLATYWNLLKIAGAKVIASTMTPIGGVNVPAIDAYNAWIVANWSTYCDALADYKADPLIGPDTAPNDPLYYQADKLHHTPLGSQIMANILVPIVKSLMQPE